MPRFFRYKKAFSRLEILASTLAFVFILFFVVRYITDRSRFNQMAKATQQLSGVIFLSEQWLQQHGSFKGFQLAVKSSNKMTLTHVDTDKKIALRINYLSPVICRGVAIAFDGASCHGAQLQMLLPSSP